MTKRFELILPEKILSDDERGCIICPDLNIPSIEAQMEISNRLEYDLDAMRSAILLFDFLESPITELDTYNGILQFPENSPEGLEDISQRTSVKFRDSLLFLSHLQISIIETYNFLNERQKGAWAINRTIRSLPLPISSFEDHPAIKLKIQNCLPFPHKDVAYEDIFLFKSRRSDELSSLRNYIEEIEHLIASCDFSETPQRLYMKKLENSVKDYQSCLSETNFKKVLGSLEISLSISDFLKSSGPILATSIAATSIPLSEFGWMALAGLGGSISINATSGYLNSKKYKGPFEYFYHYERNL